MKNLRKFRRLFSVMCLCGGLFTLASANTPALGAATYTASPAGTSDNMMESQYAYNIGYIIGALLNLAGYGYGPQTELTSTTTAQLPAAKYQATDFSTFD